MKVEIKNTITCDKVLASGVKCFHKGASTPECRAP